MYREDWKVRQEWYMEEKEKGPRLLQTFPLDTLDATATLADLETQFPGIRLTVAVKEAKVIVLANLSELAKIKARINRLKGKADDK
jgi:hypothetical protein